MGGRIWVESEPGAGSRFHFTTRLGLQRTPSRRAALAEPEEVRDLPVLIVDDNATNRRILREILTNWQMRPVDVPSGAEALKLLKRRGDGGQSFALALVDANMPGMDGFDLINRVRKDPALKGLKIMILTSSDRLGDIVRCRDLDVQAYLTKPVKQSELLDAILLAQGSRLAAGAAPEIITRPVTVAAGPPLRILLAEDNPINQKVAVHILEKRGHRVRTAGNGIEVLDALEAEEFDVILMDVQMPVLDGFEATARIREREEKTRRHVPVIALTAHALKEDRKRCLEAGMDDYVSKPLKPAELFRTLACLSLRTGPRPSSWQGGTGTPRRPWRASTGSKRSSKGFATTSERIPCKGFRSVSLRLRPGARTRPRPFVRIHREPGSSRR